LASSMGHAGHTIEVEVRGQPADIATRLEALPGVVGTHRKRGAESATVFTVSASTDIRAEVARLLVASGCDLLRLESRTSASLESIFMAMTHKGGPQ
jgi:hypothetical protein